MLVTTENPIGLIGEKVVYNEKHLNWYEKRGREIDTPLPKCGYFTITKTILYDDGRVMVALHPYPPDRGSFRDGTHICIQNLKKYKS
jgi:hypothetical protein